MAVNYTFTMNYFRTIQSALHHSPPTTMHNQHAITKVLQPALKPCLSTAKQDSPSCAFRMYLVKPKMAQLNALQSCQIRYSDTGGLKAFRNHCTFSTKMSAQT
jgi:hypothetical protein